MLKSTYRPAVAPPLPAGWTEHKAPTGEQTSEVATYLTDRASTSADCLALGHPYYHNATTKESTYIRPTGIQQLPAKPPQSVGTIGPTYGGPHGGIDAGYPNGAFANSGGFKHHQITPGNSYRGRGDWRGGHSRQQRSQPVDRPKSKHSIPGCEPWLLVYTKLGRRFVCNPEKEESFWKFPLDVMKGVLEHDRVQRENRIKEERGDPMEDNDEELLVAAEELAAVEGPATAPAATTREVRHDRAEEDSDELEEVEVTDDEDDENPLKRQKTEEGDVDQPVEFNEDDIAYQLAAMGQDYGLDPGEYGEGEGENLEEGAEGLALAEEDSSALFKDMLDDYHIDPYTHWDKIIEAGHIVEDDRYIILSNMKSRKEVWGEWSREQIQRRKEQRERAEKKDPRIPYLSFLEKHATPKLYWPEFRRKYKKETEMRDTKLSDKEREKYYRDYINRKLHIVFSMSIVNLVYFSGLKLPETTLKSDLVTLLKSIPLHHLNRSTILEALPSPILTDLRYISLRSSVRNPMVETYIAGLFSAPDSTDISPEEEKARLKEKDERERREKALMERQKTVQEEKRRQRGQLQASKGMLREGEEEIERAMKVGKEGLKGYLQVDEKVEEGK